MQYVAGHQLSEMQINLNDNFTVASERKYWNSHKNLPIKLSFEVAIISTSFTPSATGIKSDCL